MKAIRVVNSKPRSVTSNHFISSIQPHLDFLCDLGKIINMETVSINHEHRSGAFDPDACFWSESGDSRNYFLNVVRLYYDETEGSTINKIGKSNSEHCTIIHVSTPSPPVMGILRINKD